MKKFIKSKKGVAALATLAALAAAIGAYAYFTSTGSGSGSGSTATPAALTIEPVGAGYDSVIPANSTNGINNYTQDQAFEAGDVSEIGNDVTLANPGDQQLVSVVVALRNWNSNGVTGLPVTLTINNTVAGPLSVTRDFNIPPATLAGVTPSTYNAVFQLNSLGAYVAGEFVYGISYPQDSGFAGGDTTGVNVALSSSGGGATPGNDLSVGKDTDPGTIYLNVSPGYAATNDFPGCMSGGTAGTFSQWTTNGCSYSSGNPGAYGTPTQVAAGSADIPAVEFNVVGGVVPDLSPGVTEPLDFAVINPGTTSVLVPTITTSLTGVGDNGGPDPTCRTSWYDVDGTAGGPGVTTINQYAPPGTTIFSPSSATVSMPVDNANNQDNCEGEALSLGFTTP